MSYAEMRDAELIAAWRVDQERFARKQLSTLTGPLWLEVLFRAFVLCRQDFLEAFDVDCRRLIFSWILNKKSPKAKVTQSADAVDGEATYLPSNKRLFELLLDCDSLFSVPTVRLSENEPNDMQTTLMLYVFRTCYEKVRRSLSKHKRHEIDIDKQRCIFMSKFEHRLQNFFGYMMRAVRNELFALLHEAGYVFHNAELVTPIVLVDLCSDGIEGIPDPLIPEEIVDRAMTQTTMENAVAEFVADLSEKERIIIEERYLDERPPRLLVKLYPQWWATPDELYNDIDHLKSKAIKHPAFRQVAELLRFRTANVSKNTGKAAARATVGGAVGGANPQLSTRVNLQTVYSSLAQRNPTRQSRSVPAMRKRITAPEPPSM